MEPTNQTPLWARIVRGMQYAGMIALLILVFIANGTQYQRLASFIAVVFVFIGTAANSIVYSILIQKHCTKPVWPISLLWTALSGGVIAYFAVARGLWQNLTASAVICLVCLLGFGGVEALINNLCVKFPNKPAEK